MIFDTHCLADSLGFSSFKIWPRLILVNISGTWIFQGSCLAEEMHNGSRGKRAKERQLRKVLF